MNSNERRLKILYMLQSGKKMTTRTLTEKFNISKRTVYRDLTIIGKLGVPLTHYPGIGYGVMRDGLIPPMMFTFRELSIIMMGLSFVTSQVDKEMVIDAENVSLKISNAVPSTLREQMNLLWNKTLVAPFTRNVENRESGGDWFTICTAFVEKKPVSFLYEDKSGIKSRRVIDPKLLVHYTDHWNVIGFCHERKALRNFVLSRISNIAAIHSPILKEDDYPLDNLLYGRSEKNIPVTVTIAQNKTFSFLTELPGRIISNKRNSNHSRITFTIDNLDYINEWLLRFGNQVTIISPEELKQKRIIFLNKLLNDLKK